MGDYHKALLYYKKDLKISEIALPPNHPSLTISYNSIGLVHIGEVYTKMDKYSNALSWHEQSLGVTKVALPPNHLGVACSYSNSGLVYDNMGEYSKALPRYE
ncbi:unnamed protein product [Rotaria magnacalcarata]|uniref:Uncharacterized protein n=1 Tax=Rotaria magnacalcarata TaxID=392030 RepID=A0A814DMY9_9BILA|nr:unnamed protein product [Rotaria magnacalcarata]CAF1491850.1 unnamed protein product [Rotaria magnacalcarata]CAF2140128.1 unnamed protein product [Rotaria magnacalcarata]CAF4447102.1 unnamed protein product [Rotaria magnacalcarata]CAF5094552.1 unnamed protein product [Rotaria magnacalcarata]